MRRDWRSSYWVIQVPSQAPAAGIEIPVNPSGLTDGEVIRQHQLYAKFRKCEFWLRSLTFLGHVVSDKGVAVDPRKTEVVKNWPKPLTPTDIRSYLGLTSYYHRFVEGFYSIVASLTTLTKKKAKFEWTEACEKSFQ
ncbi:uncharacterized mitochondrial protein AtMg00860-like [Solanum lycopersicum]|uniref:uncharacterized mitochondrial protein AtMg00860-like n=1 Tax=Solanum lycopersicum TaxID=4081 RepID=UPI003749E654